MLTQVYMYYMMVLLYKHMSTKTLIHILCWSHTEHYQQEYDIHIYTQRVYTSCQSRGLCGFDNKIICDHLLLTRLVGTVVIRIIIVLM